MNGRLEFVAATPELLRAALAGPSEFVAKLGATAPSTWPPMYVDQAALEYTLDRLAAGPEQAGWWMHFVVLVGGEGKEPGVLRFELTRELFTSACSP